jgi:hypothetical protein
MVAGRFRKYRVRLHKVAVQARLLHRMEPYPYYIAWGAGMATPLSWLS